jgi:hypothetical protein
MTGTPSAKLCFVIMPFKEERWEVFKHGIEPACVQAGFQAVRVDQLQGVFNITREIIEHIFRCDVIIAEVTDQNPNVFYEMGVAHTIGNKTIMIAQKAADLPFDIRNYRCIIYKQSVEGLQRLQKDLVASLQEIEKWRAKPSNPVQDFKPPDAFVLNSDFERLQKTLRQKEELLAAAQMETAAVQKQLREKDERLKLAVPKPDWETLQKELAQKRVENSGLQKEIERLRMQVASKGAPPPSPKSAPRPLRSQPLDNLSVEQVKKMLQEKNFFDSDYHKNGNGLQHQYEVSEQEGAQLVADHATGLIWQRAGSEKELTYEKAKAYVTKLRQQNYGGFSDWRLPTLEEAMSLMEPEKKNDDLYIAPEFDSTQRWIWTADTPSAGVAWVAYFGSAFCNPHPVAIHYFVRVVR